MRVGYDDMIRKNVTGRREASDFHKSPTDFSYVANRGWRLTADQKSKVNKGTHVIRYVPMDEIITVGVEKPSYVSRELVTNIAEKGALLPIIEGQQVNDVGYVLNDGKLRFDAYAKKGYKKIPILLKV